MRSRSMPWQLVPWARMILPCLACIRYSMAPLVLRRPALFCHAVEQKDVDVVDTQLHAIALEMASRVGDVGRMVAPDRLQDAGRTAVADSTRPVAMLP